MNKAPNQKSGGRSAPPTRPNTRPNLPAGANRPGPTYRGRAVSTPPGGYGDVLTQQARSRYNGESRRRRIRLVLGMLALLVLSGAAVALVLAGQTITTVSSTIQEVFETPVGERVTVDEEGKISTPVKVTYPEWGKEPVNILLIGLDYRPGEEDTRADTQIIVHIDPVSKSAAMVSIPRDLWVPIPGFGEGRINSTYQTGETDAKSDDPQIPGGGPGLAKATIEDNFGIPIHYYAQVNFSGFEQIIDTIGGVNIDVPRPLVDNMYPLGNYGVTRIYIPAGLQHMDGRTALAYARSRHADSDLGRNARQQQVLLAIRRQGMSLDLLGKLNELAGELSDAVRTDLSVSQVGSLMMLAQDIDMDSIQTVQIDASMVRQTFVGGADVLVPNWEIIRPLIAQAFADPRLAKEAARLSVQNGTNTGGVGKNVRDVLVQKGFSVPDLRSVDNPGEFPTTEITDFTGGQKPRTIDALLEILDLSQADVQKGDPEEAPVAQTDGEPVDIMIIVGDEKIHWPPNTTMP
ncbi:MAG TPA: LCP family protein [Chloroflexia bacterium]|nr:LCP family protein [Chloroflexia bacterium]